MSFLKLHLRTLVSNRRAFLCLGLAWLAGSGANVGWAAPANEARDIVPVLKAFKVVVKDDVETLVPAERIKPGEVIEYQVQYRNGGKRAVRSLQAVLPIPAPLEFVSGSATPASVQASVDGKTFASLPLRRRIKGGDGAFKIVPVPLSQYRFLRWKISELPSGQTVSVRARARLAD